jgi:formate dehydrogenase major subunit
VTAVHVAKVAQPSEWQKAYRSFSDNQLSLLENRIVASE